MIGVERGIGGFAPESGHRHSASKYPLCAKSRQSAPQTCDD